MAPSRLRWQAIAQIGKGLPSDPHATTLAAALVYRTASISLAALGGQISLAFASAGDYFVPFAADAPRHIRYTAKRVLGCTAMLLARQGSELAELDENASTPDAQR
jgi:hypothetical protein